MNCVIYFGMLLYVKSSFVISSTDRCFELINKILCDEYNLIPTKKLSQKERLDKANEIALMFGNQSVEPIDEYVKVEETEFENVFELLPKHYSSSLVVSVGTIIERFQEIKDKNKNVSKNVKKIIKKLETFDENEFLDLRICKQIMNNQYYPVPHNWVLKCHKLNSGFKKYDPDNTGRIAFGDFKCVIEKVLVNDLVKTNILNRFSGVKDVCYEAWLLKIRKNLYESQFGVQCLAMKCLTGIA
ncbi:uncharacterized protein LOC126906539 isoform X1 [Daktulosphaira vitifoliae]|uniref:uncharacterized protein LOC126906539 isoform X1 n=1 Tax=Daktulosphaira vitifoliae TaxID=58002 RepID=UPI0021AA9090|nr:uncharacterized protein LOC126906539 isoform X1 [Daktulosphaira vitifoliae]